MKPIMRVLLIVTVAVSLLGAFAYGKELGARDAREAIAKALGLDKPDGVRVKRITTGMAGEAIVEATVDAAFHLSRDREGTWNAVEVRAGDRRWESLGLIQTAIRNEKKLRTTADLQSLSAALESFRRERGVYVAGGTAAALLDNLSPQYLPSVIRLDAWSHEFEYNGTANGYRLSSAGPDGKPGTADDIIIENGQLKGGQ
jgi:type II secretion system (T2SS) protein G